MSTNTTPARTRVPQFLARFMTQEDPVDRQLRELAKQGTGMSRLAHFCATLLVILFSAGSLVALGSDALDSILRDWTASHSLDVPSAISVSVSTLLVLCMDTAMIAAASTLRLLAARHVPLRERWTHVAIMVSVCLLEALTYAVMSWKYEHPATFAAGALILARACAAPILATYLAMARPRPATSLDILSMVELASAAGVLRDVTQAARDPQASLHRKMELYNASAILPPTDRQRLQNMIAAVQAAESPTLTGTNIPTTLLAPSESPYTRTQEGPGYAQLPAGPSSRLPRLAAPSEALGESDYDPDRPPTGPGSPIGQRVRTDRVATSTRPTVLRLDQPDEWPERTAARGSTRRSNGRGVRTPRKPVNHEQVARSAWATGATSVEKMRRATGMSKAAASSWVRTLKMERDTTLSHQQLPSPVVEESEVAQ